MLNFFFHIFSLITFPQILFNNTNTPIIYNATNNDLDTRTKYEVIVPDNETKSILSQKVAIPHTEEPFRFVNIFTGMVSFKPCETLFFLS